MAHITFHTEYRTAWGEELKVLGSIPELGNFTAENAFPLQTNDGMHWSGTISTDTPETEQIHYYYCIVKNKKLVAEEWKLFPRYIQLEKNQTCYETYDKWKMVSGQLHFYSSAFTECLLARHGESTPIRSYSKELVLKVHCPRIHSDYALGICGNQEALGNWDTEKAVLLNDRNAPEWQIALDVSTLRFPLEYKFVLCNLKTHQVEAWEMHDNRYVNNLDIKEHETIILADHYVYFDQPQWKGAGVAIPVFSLRSAGSLGIGDFGDLKLMIDWAVQTHQKIVQILPINDTTMSHTWMDSYPYNSISIFALHPVYLDVKQLGVLQDAKLQTYFDTKQKELNSLSQINYEEVEHTKWELFRASYAQDGETTLSTLEFNAFYEANRHWLQPYAAYSYLRDLYHTADFRAWPQYSTFRADEIAELCNTHHTKIALFYYLQYHLHRQLLAVSTYARQHGVILKGDIPIGISRCSVEAWAEPHYFNMNGQAGAPPDDFSVNGQNWGFPTYNWDEMEKDGYRWWMRRFQKMSEYFDAYRIDHILGFFRIWEIPMHAVHGLLGQFVPSLPLSREEIESYGLTFNEELFTKPYIHTMLLSDLFGDRKEEVIEQFLEPMKEKDRYTLRPEFNTQRKVEAYFQDKRDNPRSIQIRDGLYTLISNVLFIRDNKHPEMFHPRICVQKDYIFSILTEKERLAFNHLYDQYYYHRHNQFWQKQAMKKLPGLTGSTRMLVCGEDLGMIPECVGWVMNDLQILSLEIQRMPKDPYHEFGQLGQYPYRSVCTISTHDMSTLRGWWKESPSQIQRFYNQELRHPGEAPAEATGALCEEVIRQHLRSNSMLSILAFQDWLSMDELIRLPDADAERINIPSCPRHYWRYRMHLTLEELLQAESLNERIRRLIDENGRNPEF